MKFTTTCMVCLQELGHPSFQFIDADYYEDATCYITCNRSHKSAVVLQSLKFEILMESAAKALLNGYTLEAASSLSSAYERVIEFAVHVMSLKLGIETPAFDATYKQMAKQSERQIGAFLMMYAAIFKSEFQLSTKIPPKRNEVIHQGRILSPAEVMVFGELVYSEIKSITDRLRTLDDNVMHKAVMEILQRRYAAAPRDVPKATSTGTTFFSLSRGDNPASFSEALDKLKEWESMHLKSAPYLKLLSAATALLRPKKKNGS